MNIYVETNFVLELAFEQEQCASCQDILALCETGQARLIVPGYSLAEPHEKLARQEKSRREIQAKLEIELRQLARNAAYRTKLDGIKNIANLLAESSREEKQRFVHYRERLVRTAEIIPLTQAVLVMAAEYEIIHGLSPQDALVYASIITHMRQSQKVNACFLNKNSKDFETSNILGELAQYQCTLIPRFDHGLSFIQARLLPP